MAGEVEVHTEISQQKFDAALHAPSELSPEEWNNCTLTIPDVTETQAFGRAKIKTFFNIHVNGDFYRGYLYSEFNNLLSQLKKALPNETKAFPKFPPKNRLSIGTSTSRQAEDRRVMFQIWMKHVVTRPLITKHSVFQNFIKLKPDYDEIEKDLNAKVETLTKIVPTKWKQTQDKYGVKIWTLDEKLDGSNFVAVRTYVKIKVSLKNVLDTFNSKTEMANWRQPVLKVIKSIDEILGKGIDMPCKEVVYAAYNVPVIRNRDVAVYCTRYMGTPTDPSDTSKATALSCSIIHPNAPKVKGMVRGNINVSQTTFSAIDGGSSTEVESIMHMDPKGMIPATVVNAQVAKAVDTIKDMRVYMEQKFS